MKKILLITAFIFVAFGMMAQSTATGDHNESKQTDHAICVLYPTLGNMATGIIHFTRVEGGVKITADIQNLSKGKHGIHIHEYGDCSALDGNSAGGHYNPAVKTHGAPVDDNRHIGDMGNIEADESGKGLLEYVDKTLTLDGPNSIIGRAVIVHANEDDLKTQPTGNAGARLACGVIGVAK